MGEALLGLFADQVQRDRDVVRAEAPQRVLVGPQLAEVQAVAVEVVQPAELVAVDQLLQARRPRGGTRAGGRPSGSCPACGRGGDRALGVGGGGRQRLLDEAVLARLGHRDRELGVRGHGRGEHDRVERRGSLEQLVELARRARAGERRARARSRACCRGVAQPRELAAGDRGEVAREVRAPVAEARRRRRAPASARRSCARARGLGERRRSPPRSARPRGRRRRAAGRSLGGGALERRERRVARRGRRACSSRVCTVSTHSVLARSVTQGTPARYASFWTPPESVSDRARLAEQRAELDVAERPGQRQARRRRSSSSSRPASVRRARVRGCSGNSTGVGQRLDSSTSARRRSGSSTLPARWAVSSR